MTRIFDRLCAEHGMTDVSYPVVRAYVAQRRPEIRTEHGRADTSAFVPQTHLPRREAEVDFGEVSVRLRGQLVTCHLFSLRMSYSGKVVHRVSATGGQEAFFEGHVHAFEVLGGVPAGRIRYDNLKAAVTQVIGFSRQRVEADRWVTFRSHFDIDAFYCQPGITGPMRRAASKATSAASGATTWRPFPKSTGCVNSTNTSMNATTPTTAAASGTACIPSARPPSPNTDSLSHFRSRR